MEVLSDHKTAFNCTDSELNVLLMQLKLEEIVRKSRLLIAASIPTGDRLCSYWNNIAYDCNCENNATNPAYATASIQEHLSNNINYDGLKECSLCASNTM